MTYTIGLLSPGFMKESKESLKLTVVYYAKEIKKLGHTIYILTERKDDLPLIGLEQDVPIFRSACGKIFSYPLSLLKAKKHAQVHFDIIHGFSAAPILIIRSLLGRVFNRNAKIVHTLKSYSKSSFGRKYYRLLNRADAITVPTLLFKDLLVKNGVKEGKISIIRSHIDTTKFVPLTGSKKEHRESLDLPTDKKIIYYYGATWKDKGVSDLLDAFSLLCQKRDGLFLVIAPRYPIEKEHKDHITRLGIASKIRIIEEKIDVVRQLQAADICVLPYKSMVGTENNPSCLIECLACKVPVVTTRVPELCEIVEENSDVLMAEPNNPHSLAKEISRLLDDSELSKRLVTHAFPKSLDFDIKKIASKFVSLYDSLMKSS